MERFTVENLSHGDIRVAGEVTFFLSEEQARYLAEQLLRVADERE